MNKLKLLLMSSLLSVMFVGCSDKEGDKETPDNPRSDKELKITVTLPDGWEPVEGSVLEHQYMKGSASFMIKEETLLNNKKLDDAVGEAKQTIEKYFDNTNFIETKTMQVDDHDAQAVLFTYSVKAGGQEIKMKMQSIYVMVATKCQLISFGDLENSFSTIEDDIPIILQGIHFDY